jgi:hypothetical protein
MDKERRMLLAEEAALAREAILLEELVQTAMGQGQGLIDWISNTGGLWLARQGINWVETQLRKGAHTLFCDTITGKNERPNVDMFLEDSEDEGSTGNSGSDGSNTSDGERRDGADDVDRSRSWSNSSKPPLHADQAMYGKSSFRVRGASERQGGYKDRFSDSNWRNLAFRVPYGLCFLSYCSCLLKLSVAED